MYQSGIHPVVLGLLPLHIVATTGGIVDPADLTALADAHLVPSPIMTARTSKITALSGGRDG